MPFPFHPNRTYALGTPLPLGTHGRASPHPGSGRERGRRLLRPREERLTEPGAGPHWYVHCKLGLPGREGRLQPTTHRVVAFVRLTQTLGGTRSIKTNIGVRTYEYRHPVLFCPPGSCPMRVLLCEQHLLLETAYRFRPAPPCMCSEASSICRWRLNIYMTDCVPGVYRTGRRTERVANEMMTGEAQAGALCLHSVDHWYGPVHTNSICRWRLRVYDVRTNLSPRPYPVLCMCSGASSIICRWRLHIYDGLRTRCRRTKMIGKRNDNRGGPGGCTHSCILWITGTYLVYILVSI